MYTEESVETFLKLMLEERRREVEADLEAAVMKGRRNGMTDEELEDASEVFVLPSGGYLLVEG